MANELPPTIKEPRGWIRWVVLAVGVAFGVAVPFNLHSGNTDDAIGGMVLAALGIGEFFVMTRARAGRLAFLRWLQENAAAVRHGAATWEGQAIDPTTKLRRFDTAISMLLISTKISSKFVVDGAAGAASVRWGSVLASLLLGWWGFPFGPVYTLSALFRNLRGGHVVTVGELLTEVAPQIG
jgi:hypothetical protein